METFYSIQGEGFHTGKAAFFIRLGGCDVGCSWCDEKDSWNACDFPLVSVEEITARVLTSPCTSVVVTGGEPLLYNLDTLCKTLKSKGIQSFLETSGREELSGEWDWICLSPKRGFQPSERLYQKADELKVIVQREEDLIWAAENAGRVRRDCLLFLQPEWSRRNEILPVITRYILAHPQWMLSLQTHKYAGIP
ncbi:MAG: 7-carboxy-7-deazaguanine synthase QueE [Bacteroidetes bacterium]|nr:7-carboxy-7-deazaguanine synthase QueE [Bacteroidota bacterium]